MKLVKILLVLINISFCYKVNSQDIHSNFYVPQSGPPDLYNNVQPPTNLKLPDINSSGESAQKMMKDIQEIQQKSQELLNQQTNNNFDGGEKELQEGIERLKEALNPEHPSIQATNQEMDLSNNSPTLNSSEGKNEVIDISRYTNSPCFQSLGYTPNNPNMESYYLECERSKRNEQAREIAIVVFIILLIIGVISMIFYFSKKKNNK